jgi:glycosyltransferase involved in cell wall biosynthesis
MISIIIPALNEEKKLKDTVYDIIQSANECAGIQLDIVIINDGSSDGTGRIIKELEREWPFIRSIHNEINLGVGCCIKKALKILKYDRFIWIPSDNDMPKELIKELFQNINKAEMIMAYFINKEARSRWRNIISSLYGLIYAAVFNVYVQYINGSCIYPTQKIRQLNLQSDRFSIAAEMSTKMLLLGCSFYEVGGYMQTGETGSSAMSFKNLIEVIVSFIRLFIEVKITKRAVFNKKINRVY